MRERGEKKSNKRNHGVFPCEKCGRTYVRKDSLQRHMAWECGKDPMFQCPFCPQKCKRKSHHIRHIQRQHRDMLDLMEVARSSALSPRLPQKDPSDPNSKIPQLPSAPKSENDTAGFITTPLYLRSWKSSVNVNWDRDAPKFSVTLQTFENLRHPRLNFKFLIFHYLYALPLQDCNCDPWRFELHLYWICYHRAA
ncbi:hypothetical protein GE061_003348 [Apolygus lucorum]|uniref:C2H2-type domain-containing protein n=1 Tax=Apolygus lucorum TaxID=248454 RepID=A0A8S9X3N1_APOLU|nr:hypothetical protein GE061_003348 [Apolygus lucorum]